MFIGKIIFPAGLNFNNLECAAEAECLVLCERKSPFFHLSFMKTDWVAWDQSICEQIKI